MLKVTVIGGGSTYTPELFSGFLRSQEDFPLDEFWLMDIDAERLNLVGEFVQRIAAAHNARFRIVLSTNQRKAVQGSAYVITQTRVGGMQARRQDEYLGKRHGLIGQETTGVGGMANALRTIPVILNVAEDIKKFAPEALLVNFANPAGLVTEAVHRYAPEVHSVGVCNVAIGLKMEILHRFKEQFGKDIQPQNINLKCLGLNHLSWFYGCEVDGMDYWPEIMTAYLDEMGQEEEPLFDIQTLQSLHMLPNYYLRYYYYTEKMLAQQDQWPPSRAEEIFQIEDELLSQYQQEERVDLPEDMLKRGGAYYSSVAVELLNAHYNDLNQTQVLNVRHNGAVKGWDKDWVLEMPCVVSAAGVEPLPADPLPLACEGLVAAVKAYEVLTAQAAVFGDYDAAYQAMLVHPLGPPANRIKPVLDDVLEINRKYLPQFIPAVT